MLDSKAKWLVKCNCTVTRRVARVARLTTDRPSQGAGNASAKDPGVADNVAIDG
jgi:hypothetical protein